MKITPDAYNKDRIVTANIPWKSNVTFNQLSSVIKKNYSNAKSFNIKGRTLFKALPLKIYRREIASTDINACKSRASVKIDQFDMPGVNIVTKYSNRGINAPLDINYENNSGRHPSLTATDPTYCTLFSDKKNALRRVRSSGIIKQNYCTSSTQYLYNRGLTFQQNSYFHVNSGDNTLEPGAPGSSNNIYGSNTGVKICPQKPYNYIPIFYKPSNYKFGNQGAVTSSNRTLRKKYDTVTNATSTFRTAFGNQTTNALAYGVPEYGYTAKNVIGFPLIKCPVITPAGKLKTCTRLRTIRNLTNG